MKCRADLSFFGKMHEETAGVFFPLKKRKNVFKTWILQRFDESRQWETFL